MGKDLNMLKVDMWENGLSMWETAEICWKRLKIEICEKLMCGKRLKSFGNILAMLEMASI